MQASTDDSQSPPEYEEEDIGDIDDLPNYAVAVSSPRYANFSSTSSSSETHATPGTLRLRVDDANNVFSLKTKHFSLTFANQPSTGPRPIYGRSAALQGVLTVFKPGDVASIFLKFEARMFHAVDTPIGAGENDISLFEETLKVFPKKEIASHSTRSPTRLFSRGFTSIQQSNETCPHELPFTLPIPSSYLHGGTSYLLPPTYSVRILYKGIIVRVRYEFKVIITRKSTILDRTASVTIPIMYAPRSHPSTPIRDALPDDWKIFTVRSDNTLPHDVGVQAFLALPSSQVYPIDTKIPFYLQLWSASPSTLAMYVQEPPPTGNVQAGRNSETAHIEIKVLRSFRLDVLSQPSVKINRALAIADIWRCGDEFQPAVQIAIQLAQAGTTAFSVRNGNACMSWQGEFIVSGDGALWGDCAGFLAPKVFIRDVVVLRIIPPKYKDHPLKRIEYFIPVRLTTDPYRVQPVHGMDIVQSQI